MKHYETKMKAVMYSYFGIAILIILLLLTGCEKEQCFICDVEQADLVYLSSGIYVRWEYKKQEIFCDGIPTSDNQATSTEDYFDRYPIKRYTNCIPY